METYQTVLSVIIAWIVITLSRLIYQVFFHPLSCFPGSRWAACSTLWYEYYWNIIQDGSLLFEIERLHELHGPVIRIGTNELHTNSPELYDEIFKAGSKFYKDPVWYDRLFMLSRSTIAGTDPAAHRVRREIIGPGFTKHAMDKLTPLIEAKVNSLFARFDELSAKGEEVNFTKGYKAFSLDVTARVVFGHDWNVIQADDFYHSHIEALRVGLVGAWYPRLFPTIFQLITKLPYALRSYLTPPTMLELLASCHRLVEQHIKKEETSRAEATENRVTPSVIELLLHPPKHYKVPDSRSLDEETLSLLIAGNDTASVAALIGTHRIARQPDIYQKLQQELDSATKSHGDPRYSDLQQLPYFNAVLKEIFREGAPFPGKLPRIVPAGGLTWENRVIPAGTSISISPYITNRNKQVFSAGDQFQPERWLRDDTSYMDKHVATFIKGSRQCLGIHLARCELYLLLGNLFQRYEVVLATDSADAMQWRDYALQRFRGDLKARLVRRV